jgi:hypothetical protein
MAIRSNHYEAAFEAYIRSILVPCVAVGLNLVVEVKGKRGRDARGRRPWENWVTTDDLDGLARWEGLFGPGFRAILAFVYAESAPEFSLPRGDGAFPFRGALYRFWAVGLDDYVAHLRSRGPAWKAVAMARAEFRRHVRPLIEWLPMTPSCPQRPRPLEEIRR